MAEAAENLAVGPNHPLDALTADEAGAVRSTAAFALGIVEDPLPPEAISALETALTDASSRVREKAL